MEEYIKKSAVVAEIERIKKEECPVDSYEGRCKLLWFEQFLSFLNALKVKEVDLEKEIKLYKMRNPIIGHREESLNNYMSNVAKYFFGLGLKVNKGE